MFVYHLPKIDNTTEFDLISGPYGATVMENGTLTWKAISNLIADSWSELFIIKANGKSIFSCTSCLSAVIFPKKRKSTHPNFAF